MAEHQFENALDKRQSVPHASSNLRALETGVGPQPDPLRELTTHGPAGATAEAHASALNRLSSSRTSGAASSLLRLQRQYGNRYVQRVVSLARGSDTDTEVAPGVEPAIERARGGGQALDSGVRRQMESAFGADFGGVRVHADSEAHALNESLNALAFATGRDIFFRRDTYDPGSKAGKELLAHELTHVVQQSGGAIQTKLDVSEPGDRSEQEADLVAKQVVAKLERGDSAAPGGSSDSLQPGTIGRECSCGGHTASGGECEECRAKRLSRHHSLDATSTHTRTMENDEDIAETVSPFHTGVGRLVQRQDGDGGQQDGGQQDGAQAQTLTACTPTKANFTSIPSGTLTPTVSVGKFGAPFDMKAEFTTAVPCTCVSGEYRQFVRGFFKINGTALTHALCSNTMSTTTFFEDCATVSGTNYKYGYHSIPFATSNFSNPDQATGCNFVGFDYPGVNIGSLSTGDKVEIHLDFQGKLVDASSGDAQLAASSWTVDGSTTIP
jgi:hypothetical protein